MSPFPQRAAAMLCMCAAFGVLTTSRLLGFALIGDSWPAGSDIVMHLSLSRAATGFQDGSASWNASAADALRIWNEHLGTVRFVEAGSVASGNGDGVNSVFFSNSVYGEKFGTNTIAVTVGFNDAANPAIIVETDVIFNTAERWNSYRGPVQFDSGGKPIYDLHRVALHEFGHVLGLDHPDKKGQPDAHALMNSAYGDNDALTDDDIAGAQHLYGRRKVEVATGGDFSYQVVAGNEPIRYSAVGLPPGLSIDEFSGLIRGVPTISGSYSVSITAFGRTRDVTLTIEIVVAPPPPPPPASTSLRAKHPVVVSRLAPDPIRPRMYGTVPASNSVVVIDTNTLQIAKTIAVGPSPAGLSVSADQKKLWVANSGSSSAGISIIDLETLEVAGNLPTPALPYDVEEGLAGRLYVVSAPYTTAGIMQIDSATGASHRSSAVFDYQTGGFIEISPDRKTLYYADKGASRLVRYDISAVDPVSVESSSLGTNGHDLALSKDGRHIVYPCGGGNGDSSNPPYTTFLIPSGSLTSVEGVFNVGPYPGQATFSNDDAILFHYGGANHDVTMFDTRTFAPVHAIDLNTDPRKEYDYDVREIAVDNTGGLLFVSTGWENSAEGDLRVYATGRTDTRSVPPAARTLINVSTRLRAQAGDDSLIAGFIITGHEAKRVAIRAIGPSIDLGDRLADPLLSLDRSDGAIVAENDNWNSRRAEVLATGLAPANERESVVIATLEPGSYTAVVRGPGGSAGVALVEVYDLSASNSARVANISTRGKVETGDNVMIGGFIIGGAEPMSVIVRAIGPSLLQSGVTGALQDTTLDLHDGNGALLASNDDWRDSEQEEIEATAVPPADGRESAIVKTLAPGNYTAIVRGKNDSSGVALVEVYSLASP